jgi:Uma2 family endonuclease
MPTLVTDPALENELLERRRASRGDRWDEVWDGVYIMAPLPNIERQKLVQQFTNAISQALDDDPTIDVLPGANVSDRMEDWEHNYRCPDVTIVLPTSRAVNCGAFYFGGPDFVVEIASEYDRSREKFDFYASVGVREFLLVDRNPWQLELYALRQGNFEMVGRSDVHSEVLIESRVLPLRFRLISPEKPGRPQIEIVRTTDGHRWLA